MYMLFDHIPGLNRPKALHFWGRRSRDRMVVGFITTFAISAYITAKVMNSNPAHGFLRFPPPIKLTATILKYR